LWRTGTAKPELVPGRVVTVSEGKPSERVYDLTVENHHEFVAGGILVSNCVDALRYACESVRRTQKASKPTYVEPLPTINRW